MQPPRPLSSAHERDPIALLVEEELRNLARTCKVLVALDSSENGKVKLRFGDVVVTAETRDLALIRLTSSLLDDDRFKGRLIRILGPRLESLM